MEHIYTTAPCANYAHIQMYLIQDKFSKLIKARDLQDSDYTLESSIDGNVVSWSLKTTDERVLAVVHEAFEKFSPSLEDLRSAIKYVAKRNNLEYNIKDENHLLEAVKELTILASPPEITDDELETPYLEFKQR